MDNTIKTQMANRRKEQLTAEEYAQEIETINNTYYRLFNTDDGKFVLNHLTKIHLTGSIAERGDTPLDIGIKQGMANLVKEIFARVNQ